MTSDSNDDNIITPGSAAVAFASGVTIKHTFGENEPNSDMRLAVEKATFADGTVWVNPQVPQSTQAVTPVGVAVN